MKRWLKWGIVGAIVGFIIYIIPLIFGITFHIYVYPDILFEIMSSPFLQICASHYELSCAFYIPTILGLIYGFIIGVILSLIIKKKK